MKSIFRVLAIAALGLAAARISAAPQYRITDLGTFGGSNSQIARINATGEVVGQANTNGYLEPPHAFLYSGGAMQDLGTLGGKYSEARGINSLGQIVGGAYTASGVVHTFLYSAGVMQDLGTLGGTDSDATAINDLGQIVGSSRTSTNAHHAFLYTRLLHFPGSVSRR